MMTRAQLDAWDADRRDYLDREVRGKTSKSGPPPKMARPPSSDRIAGVADAVLRRRMDAAAEELKKPVESRIGQQSDLVLRRRMDEISAELRRRLKMNRRSPETVARKIELRRQRRKAVGLMPGFDSCEG